MPGTYFLPAEYGEELQARLRGICVAECIPGDLRRDVTAQAGRRPVGTDTGLYFPQFLESAFGGTIAHAVSKVERTAVDCGLSLTERCCAELQRTLYEVTDRMWARTLVSRMRALAQRGELPGTSPEERFQHFSTVLAVQNAQQVLRDHEFMAARSAAKLDRVAGYLADVVRAIAGALPQVTSLEPAVSTCIDRIETGLGDTHCGSRSVCIITFDSAARLVYKPRSPQLDLGYAAVAKPIMQAAGCRLMAPWVLPAGTGMIMQFLEPDPPSSPEQETAYCRALGAHAAVLYLLGGHDLHFENVIARRGGPALIDLECLFRSTPDSSVASATDAIWRLLDESVLGTMLLPTVMRIGDEAVDIGAMGFDGQALSPVNSLVVKNAGRDDMEVRLEQLPLTDADDTYGLANMSLDPWSAMRAVTDGIESALDSVLKSREEVLEHVRSRFAGARARQLMAPTGGYGRVMRMLTHPSLAADADEAARAMQRLGLVDQSDSVEILTSEIFDVLNDDVPYFSLDLDSGEIFDSRGRAVSAAAGVAPLHASIARIRALSADDIRQQASLGRSAFAEKCGEPYASPAIAAVHASGASHGQQLREISSSVANDLVAHMIHGHGPRDVANWVDVRVGGDGKALWSPGAMDHNLYGGFVGVARFLMWAGTVLDRSAYLEAAGDVLEPFARQLESTPQMLEDFPTGDHVGVSGIVKTLVEYAHLTPDRRWMQVVALQQLAGRTNLGADTGDVLSGAAGLLGACRDLASLCPEDEPLLRGIARHTIASLAASTRGGDLAVIQHSGFAHGVVGLLAQLGPWTGLEHGQELATRLGDELRSFYALDERAFHTSRNKTGRAYGWCHGSPGILLGCELFRAGAGHYPITGETVQRLRDLTEQECLGRSFSYCHGDLGTADILLRCAQLTGNAADRSRRVLTDAVVRSSAMVRSDAPSRGAFTKSLMVGTTGIGYAALRAMDPDNVPSLLG
ncbi:type 2 lanthipeptide synthetase LanM [Flexivirga lutea]